MVVQKERREEEEEVEKATNKAEVNGWPEAKSELEKRSELEAQKPAQESFVATKPCISVLLFCLCSPFLLTQTRLGAAL